MASNNYLLEFIAISIDLSQYYAIKHTYKQTKSMLSNQMQKYQSISSSQSTVPQKYSLLKTHTHTQTFDL